MIKLLHTSSVERFSEKFSFRIFVVLGFEVVWPWWPQRPQKGLRDFFKYIFEVSAFQEKRWGMSRLSHPWIALSKSSGQKFKKKNLIPFFYYFLSKSFKSLESRKENVWFLDCPDLTMSGRALFLGYLLSDQTHHYC